MAQEEQSAIPAGVFNVYEDSDDEDAYLGEQRELQKEMQELLAAKDWINQKGWDVASEAQVVSPSSGKTIDLRLDWAIENGIAKEQARSVLPEGNTVSRLYMNGTLRSWIHYIELRSANGTQKEHMEIAIACADVINKIFPMGENLN